MKIVVRSFLYHPITKRMTTEITIITFHYNFIIYKNSITLIMRLKVKILSTKTELMNYLNNLLMLI